MSRAERCKKQREDKVCRDAKERKEGQGEGMEVGCG